MEMTEMCEKRWLAVNLKAPADRSSKEDLLLNVYDEIISRFRDGVESWHFLWESTPYPHTLLLRFFSNGSVIEELGEALESFLDEEGIERTPDEAYEGEASSYGVKGWKYVMGILHLGADFAIDLIKNERTRRTEDFNKPLSINVDRWVHLFLNQLGTRIVEYDILFKLSAHRYVINMIGEERYRQVSGDLQKEIPEFLDMFTGRLNNFLRRMASQKGCQ